MPHTRSSPISLVILISLFFMGTPAASGQFDRDFSAGFVSSSAVTVEGKVFGQNSFYLPDREYSSTVVSDPEGRIWGGALLIGGITSTLAGFLYRDIYYSTKDVYRTETDADGSLSESFFTVYRTTHANPQTALLTSVGLFLNSSYWILKDRMDGVDLEEYSPLFSERNMAWASLVVGSMVIVGANLIPEYSDKVRRGYEQVTEPSGRIQYFPIQEEHREYSYRQYSVNVAAGGVYIGFALWKLLFSPARPDMNHTGAGQGKATPFRCTPIPLPGGVALSISF